MYFKREREFQYHPGIEHILEDVQGGGTIDRKSLAGAIFAGVKLDELPPLCLVVRDEKTGVFHALKTAKTVAGGSGTTIRVAKNHLFAVGDFVALGGDFKGASDAITAIDKSNKGYDVITVADSIGEPTEGLVLVSAKAKAEAGSAEQSYGSKSGEVYVTMNKVDLTVANQLSGLLVRGTVNASCMPFPFDDALKARLQVQGIRLV